MKFKRKLNNIYYERNKEKKEFNVKEIILSNFLTENNDKKDDNKPQENNHKRKRQRIYTDFILNNEEENNNNEKRKIEKTPLNEFAKFRRNRKSKEQEQEEEKKEFKDLKEKESKIRADKKKENEIKNNYQKIPEIVPYKRYKRKTNHNLIMESNALKKFLNEKKDEEKENISEIIEVKRERKRFLSHYQKGINKDKDKNKNKEIDINKNKNKINKEKIDSKEETKKEKEDLKKLNININNNKRNTNRINEEQKQEIKKDEHKFQLKHPEPRKSLIKEKEDEILSISNSKNIINNKTKEINSHLNSAEEKKVPENLEKSESKKKEVKMSKIPGMSESLYNHVMKRISNITSKCSIQMMNIED